MSDRPGQAENNLRDDRGAEEGSGHDEYADDDHLPSLFQEGADLITDGDSRISAHQSQRCGEVDLVGRLNDKFAYRGDRACSQKADDRAVSHDGEAQRDQFGADHGSYGDREQHKDSGQRVHKPYLKAYEICQADAEAGYDQQKDPFQISHFSFPLLSLIVISDVLLCAATGAGAPRLHLSGYGVSESCPEVSSDPLPPAFRVRTSLGSWRRRANFGSRNS